MIKLSVITINLNNVSGLSKTIASVVEQTFNNFEYIIIDGGSVDNSVEVLKGYADKITFWVSEPDNGIYHAMNKGILKATGEYCLFLNSGDFLYNSQVLSDVFAFDINADIVCGDAYFEKSYLHNDKYIIAPETLKASDLILSFLPHQSTFIKRILFDQIHLYDETLIINADWAFLVEAILIFRKTYQKIGLIVSSCNTTGISSQPSNNDLMEKEFHKTLNKIIPFFYEDFLELSIYRSEHSSLNYQLLTKFGNTTFFKLIVKLNRRILKHGIFFLKK